MSLVSKLAKTAFVGGGLAATLVACSDREAVPIQISDFVDMMKVKGVKEVEVSQDANITNEEAREIRNALDIAPYCPLLYKHMDIRIDTGYWGIAEHDKILIALPKQKPNLDDPYKYENDKERSIAKSKRQFLRGIPLHECGHIIDSQIWNFYAKLNKIPNSDGLTFSHILDIGYKVSQNEHPLYRVLARMEGFGFEGKEYRVRDERFGDGYTRHMSEYFAELFEISRLKPKVLTDAERRFFDRLHQGFMLNGKKFLEKVALNPEILLDGYVPNEPRTSLPQKFNSHMYGKNGILKPQYVR